MDIVTKPTLKEYNGRVATAKPTVDSKPKTTIVQVTVITATKTYYIAGSTMSNYGIEKI